MQLEIRGPWLNWLNLNTCPLLAIHLFILDFLALIAQN